MANHIKLMLVGNSTFLIKTANTLGHMSQIVLVSASARHARSLLEQAGAASMPDLLVIEAEVPGAEEWAGTTGIRTMVVRDADNVEAQFLAQKDG